VPPELKPLLAVVIALAIVHAVLKVRAKASRPAGRGRIGRIAPMQPSRSTTEDASPAPTPEQALARLREESTK
jgi:hypothetical protein